MVKSIFSVLGAAGLGAGLMFLMDPNKGDERRSLLADRAGDAASSAGSAVGSAIEHVAHHARGLGNALASHAHRVGGQIGSAASDVADSVSDQYNDGRRGMRHRMNSWMGQPDHAMGPLGVTLTAVGTLVIGAGVMYLMDPKQGASRRNRISRGVRDGAEAVYDAGRRTAKQASGMVRSDMDKAENKVKSSFSSLQNEAGNFRPTENTYGRQITNPSTNI